MSKRYSTKQVKDSGIFTIFVGICIFPKISEVEDLYSTFIANFVFNSFISSYSHHVKRCYDPRDAKNIVVAKNLKNIAPESCCF